jgi:two-component system, NarL family, response regulator DesR
MDAQLAEVKRAVGTVAAPGPGARVDVVLAEDHDLVRKLIARALERAAGFSIVATAADGIAAVEAVMRARPQVAILDVDMPGLDGIAAAAAIHAALPATRILMLSGDVDRTRIERALRAGALGYLLKPAAPTELVAAVRAVSAGERYLSSAARLALLA